MRGRQRHSASETERESKGKRKVRERGNKKRGKKGLGSVRYEERERGK